MARPKGNGVNVPQHIACVRQNAANGGGNAHIIRVSSYTGQRNSSRGSAIRRSSTNHISFCRHLDNSKDRYHYISTNCSRHRQRSMFA